VVVLSLYIVLGSTVLTSLRYVIHSYQGHKHSSTGCNRQNYENHQCVDVHDDRVAQPSVSLPGSATSSASLDTALFYDSLRCIIR
jgi:hypothetical protein